MGDPPSVVSPADDGTRRVGEVTPDSPLETTRPTEAERLVADGLVVLDEVLPAEFVAELRGALMPLLEAYVAESGPNRGVRRNQMYLPFEPPFSDPRLWGNPSVLSVVEQVLGPDFECIYYGSDTPYPGSAPQPIHQDGDALFPEWGERPPTYSLSMNIPLVDVDEMNGPLEWFEGVSRPADDDVPNRFVGPAGSVLLRDTRTWHRGSENRGDAPRPMLALMYTRSWFHFPLQRPALDRSVYEALPDPGRQLFRAADITPSLRAAGDRRRLGPYDD